MTKTTSTATAARRCRYTAAAIAKITFYAKPEPGCAACAKRRKVCPAHLDEREREATLRDIAAFQDVQRQHRPDSPAEFGAS